MAEIAVNLATKQAEGLMDKLVSTVSGELSLLLGVRGEIQYIKDELEVMSAFLRRAEEKQNSDPAAKAWVKQIRELAYAVEDCVDEFALHLPRGNSKNLVATLWRRARSLGSLRARHRIAAEIRSIKLRVEEVSKRRLRYGIDDKTSSTSDDDVNAQYDPRSAALFVEDSQLVGIDGPREELVKWLLDDQPSLSLMAVVGAGGLGKTTVVKRAVESPKVTGGHFDCRAWVTISQVYLIEGLLRDMIKQIFSPPPADLEKMERIKLIQTLRVHLEGKRYVVVFDDIWKVDAWKSLEVALPRNTNGSRIIITTRIDDVVGACLASIPGDRHVQEKLSKEQSWDLFCKRAFHDKTCPKELETPSQSILEKCDGLPLAIVAIAAALASNPQKEIQKWEDMLKHLGSQLESNPSLQGVMQVLNFSYTDLPYPVKRCFLYLSKFPEDSLINCNRIKRLWVAEGLVSGHRDMTAEDVADSYLNVLISRRLILPSEFSITGKLKSFTVHDIMLKMIVSKSMEENFVHVLEKDNKWLPHGVIRRLSIHTEHVTEEFNLSFVRSMTMFGNGTLSFLSESPAFNLLRVLDFDGCTSLRNEHINVICGLLHLKYLSLRNTQVTKLPHSIGNLRNLETLDLRDKYDCIMTTIPPQILNLQRLRFLRGLFEIPANLKVGSLRALQNLGIAEFGRGMIKELLSLNELRKLVVESDFQGSDRADFCNFLKMTANSLASLRINSDADLTFLDDPSVPPLVLEKLALGSHLDRLPSWVSSLNKLVKISLWKTDLRVDAIEQLGALPSLVSLVLWYHAFIPGERIIFGAEGFPSLKDLRLNYKSLSSVVFGEGALPHVEMVWLSAAETVVGIEHLSSLKTIELRGVSTQAEDMVKEAVEAHPNHPKLIIKRV